MNNIITKVLEQLDKEGLFSKNPILGAYSMLSDNDISFHQVPTIDDNQLYISNLSNSEDIVLGTGYNIIFSRDNPKEFQKTDAEIDFVSLKRKDNIGIIPKGYGGVVRLKFKGGLPDLTKKLVQNRNEKFDVSKNSYLYFTNEEIMSRILTELEKSDGPVV